MRVCAVRVVDSSDGPQLRRRRHTRVFGRRTSLPCAAAPATCREAHDLEALLSRLQDGSKCRSPLARRCAVRIALLREGGTQNVERRRHRLWPQSSVCLPPLTTRSRLVAADQCQRTLLPRYCTPRPRYRTDSLASTVSRPADGATRRACPSGTHSTLVQAASRPRTATDLMGLTLCDCSQRMGPNESAVTVHGASAIRPVSNVLAVRSGHIDLAVATMCPAIGLVGQSDCRS